jgi:hypothetical protein
MSIKTKYIPFPKEQDHIYFIPMGDFHIGDDSGVGGLSEEGRLATKKFKGMIEWIKKHENTYTFLMGDLFDTAIRGSKGDIFNQRYNIKTGKELLYDLLSPIKDRILGAISGNHEERAERDTGMNPVDDFAFNMKIEYFPNWCAYLFLGVGDSKNKKDRRRPYIYTMYLHHMTGGGKTKGGKLRRVEYLKDMVQADIYCGAHVHLKGAFKGKYVAPNVNGKVLHNIQQTYVATGSYMGYASYSIKAQYDKPATGAPRIRMNGEPNKKKDCHVSI